jgi:dGTPase
VHNDAADALRTPYQRDRDRILHAVAFRRLQNKTQVFANPQGDHFRTRLTHTLEVAQIARTLARALAVDEDLAECCALAHDMGHPPFGHAGEDALNISMQPWGGFNHNDQTLRVLTWLEHRHPNFTGLNLCRVTLEGIIKHNGPLTPTQAPPYISAYSRQHGLNLTQWPGLEAQLASLADDIAYTAHDVDDGLRSTLLTRDHIEACPLLASTFAAVEAEYSAATPDQRRAAAARRLIRTLVHDVLHETSSRLHSAKIVTADEITQQATPMAAFSPAMQAAVSDTKKFMFTTLYRHPNVNRMTRLAERTLQGLFTYFHQAPDCLPAEWQARAAHEPLARVAADYIAGMTDRYALRTYRSTQFFES